MAAGWWTQCVLWVAMAVNKAWKWYKHILHMVTGQCEFERLYLICTSSSKSSHHRITTQLAKSFKHSSQLSHLKLPRQVPDFDADVFVDAIVAIKHISRNSQHTIASIHQWVELEKEIQSMLDGLGRLALEAYSSTNAHHEVALERLWTLLRPGVSREGGRYTKAWQQIGFQASDPQTDFRAMGFLGLLNMLYFADRYPSQAIAIVEKREYSYPFAIGSISITKNLLDLCRKGDFDGYFYRHGASLEQFDELHSRATMEFVKFYEAERPPNIMHFEIIMKKFVTKIPHLVN